MSPATVKYAIQAVHYLFMVFGLKGKYIYSVKPWNTEIIFPHLSTFYNHFQLHL
jgi:hypothetical protein